MKNFVYFCWSLAGLSFAVFFLLGSYYLVVQVPKYERVWYQASDGWENVSTSINRLTEPMVHLATDVHDLKKISGNVSLSIDEMNKSIHVMNQSVTKIPPHLARLSYDVNKIQDNIDYKPSNIMRRMMP